MSIKEEQSQRLLYEDHDAYHLQTISSRCRYQSNFKRLFFALLAINLVAVILLGAGFPFAKIILSLNAQNKKEIFPSITLKPRVFTPNESFYRVFNEEQKIAWDSLIPTAGGFVRIDDPQQYGLSGGYPLESAHGMKAESYCVSVFHQLHCLNSIREQLERSNQFNKRHKHEDLGPHTNELHVAHCLDYLRQAVMCSGDMSLEKVTVDEDGNMVHSTNGWDTQHTCKVWDEVFDITESMNSLRKTGTY